MNRNKDLRRDGVSHKDEILKALPGFIREDEKRQAMKISYGDLGVLLKKGYVNTGRCDYTDIWCMPQGIDIKIRKEKYHTQLTWNKAAKIISEYLRAGE